MKNKMRFILVVIILIFILGVYLYNVKIKKAKKQIQNNEEPNIEEEIDLFAEYYKQAEEKLKKMTLEEKVGQMLVSRADDKTQIEQIQNLHIGGIILFAVDFKEQTKESITKKIESYQETSKIPLLIAVDEEGGTVTRISRYENFRNSKFKSPQELYVEGGISKIKEIEKEKIELLKSLGINLNLSPVADVTENEEDFMYYRALGKDAKTTAEYIGEITKYINDNNFGMTLKHFPGYGNNKDTHEEVVIDERSIETFENSDFIPFKEGIKNGAQSILVSHNIMKCIDDEYPASISTKVHELLRDKLNFSGIIMTDDLEMSGITKYVTEEEKLILAVNSGNDILLVTNVSEAYNTILKNVKNNIIDEQKIDIAVKRILAWKYYLSIM